MLPFSKLKLLLRFFFSFFFATDGVDNDENNNNNKNKKKSDDHDDISNILNDQALKLLFTIESSKKYIMTLKAIGGRKAKKNFFLCSY